MMRWSLFLTILIGAIAMSETAAVADDKKEPPKKKPNSDKKESYDEKVSVREFIGGKLINPIKDVPMFRWEISGKPVMYLITSKAPKGSEITDKDGVVWVVTESNKIGTNFTHTICGVMKKP